MQLKDFHEESYENLAETARIELHSNTATQDLILTMFFFFLFLPYMRLKFGFSAFHQDNKQTIQMSLYVPKEDENKLTITTICYR